MNNRTPSTEAMVPAAALNNLIRAYVRMIEAGRDRIMDLGGTCDGVDVMESRDPWLQAAKEALSLARSPEPSAEHPCWSLVDEYLRSHQLPNHERVVLRRFAGWADTQRAPEPRGELTLARSVVTNLIAAVERREAASTGTAVMVLHAQQDLDFAMREARQFMGGLHLTKGAGHEG